jgi:hypothetical protein
LSMMERIAIRATAAIGEKHYAHIISYTAVADGLGGWGEARAAGRSQRGVRLEGEITSPARSAALQTIRPTR